MRWRICVSIHTPTKGVTFESLINNSYSGVSIHTPTKGVTGGDTRLVGGYARFNPHTHEGCDPGESLYIWEPMVSIHTPTKGVTIVY